MKKEEILIKYKKVLKKMTEYKKLQEFNEVQTSSNRPRDYSSDLYFVNVGLKEIISEMAAIDVICARDMLTNYLKSFTINFESDKENIVKLIDRLLSHHVNIDRDSTYIFEVFFDEDLINLVVSKIGEFVICGEQTISRYIYCNGKYVEENGEILQEHFTLYNGKDAEYCFLFNYFIFKKNYDFIEYFLSKINYKCLPCFLFEFLKNNSIKKSLDNNVVEIFKYYINLEDNFNFKNYLFFELNYVMGVNVSFENAMQTLDEINILENTYWFVNACVSIAKKFKNNIHILSEFILNKYAIYFI